MTKSKKNYKIVAFITVNNKKNLAPGVYYFYPKAGNYREGPIQFRYEITFSHFSNLFLPQ